jgi:endonuclease YncB( thermonuclease family)
VKLRNIGKALMNSLPIVAISVLGVMAWNRQQNVANARVDYDQENPNYVSRANTDRSSRHLKTARVVDGDTILLTNGDYVRLCGIDSPETPKKDKQGRIIKPGQPLGEEATNKLRQFIEQADNDVIIVEAERDQRERIVGDVFVRNRASRNPEEEFFVNGEMVRSGMAYHYARYSGNCSDRSALETSEEFAKSRKRGVWSGSYEKPWDFRRRHRER